MNQFKILCVMLLMALLAPSALAQTAVNRIIVPDAKVQAGKSMRLAIELENTDEVTGLQFDLHLPAGITVDKGVVTTERSRSTHQVTARTMQGGICRVLMHSTDNSPMRGNAGAIINASLLVPASLPQGASYPVVIDNLVISDRLGNALASEAIAGTITIAMMPDFEISGLATTATKLNPSDEAVLSWKVANVGELPSGAGWTEQIYLSGMDGESKYITSMTYDGTLAAGASVSRSATVSIPSVPAMDGLAVFVVKVVPQAGAGEPDAALDNNQMSTEKAVNIQKKLYISFPSELKEGSYNRSTSITRSGDRRRSETFDINVSPSDSRISIPTQVTIKAGQSSAYINYAVCDDSTLNNDSIFTIVTSGNDYPSVKNVLKVIDDERPRIFVSLAPQTVTEGDNFTISLKLERASKTDLKVNLSTNASNRFNLTPGYVIIPAGVTQTQINCSAIDNKDPELDATFRITATAPLYKGQSADIRLLDNDIPQITLEVSPTAIVESGGVAVATVKRSNTDIPLTVRLTDTPSAQLSYEHILNFAVGQDAASTTITAVDNGIVDHSRTIDLQGSVYLAADGTYAPSTTPGYAKAKIEVVDDDGPMLTMGVNRSVWVEGGSGYIILSRNTLGEEAISIKLNSDYEQMLEYTHQVTMAKGTTSMRVPVSVLRNSSVGDDVTVTLTAECEGYAVLPTSVKVSDHSMPDAVVSKLTLPTATVEVYDQFKLAAEITNIGVSTLLKGAEVTVYYNGKALQSIQLSEPVEPDQSASVTFDLAADSTIGTASIYVVVNESHSQAELNYDNNKSKYVYLYVDPGFTVDVEVDKPVYKPGETVLITGKAVGNHAANAPVKVFVKGNYGYTTTLYPDNVGADGSFSIEWHPTSGLAGHFDVGACHRSDYNDEVKAEFDIYGLRITSRSGIKHDIEAGSHADGFIEIYNPGPTLTGINITATSQLPQKFSVRVDPATISSLDKGKYAKIKYTVTAIEAFDNSDFASAVFEVTSDQEASAMCEQLVRCHWPSANLRLDKNAYNVTIPKDGCIYLPVSLSNIGRRESGQVTVISPDWISLSSGTIGSIEPYGTNDDIVLKLSAPQGVQPNVPLSPVTVSFTCPNGNGATMKISAMVVSTDKGRLIVTASDDNTYNKPGNVHVAGAKVVVTNLNTKQTFEPLYTDDEGICVFESLVEGIYSIDVSADRHRPYNNSRFVIYPGRDNELEAFLKIIPSTSGFEVPDPNDPDNPKSVEVEWDVVIDGEDAVPAITITLPKEKPGVNMITAIRVNNEGNVAVGRTDIEFTLPEGYSIELIDRPWHNLIGANSSVTFQAILHFNGDLDELENEECFAMSATVHAKYMVGPFVEMITETGRKAWGSCSDQISQWVQGGDDPDTGGNGGKGGDNPSMPISTTINLPDASNSVSLTFQLSNTLVSVQKGLEAILTVANNSYLPLQGLSLQIEILNSEDVSVAETDKFSLGLLSMAGMSGASALGADWTVASKAKANAVISLLPTLMAAQSSPEQYYIVPTIWYIDPLTGLKAKHRLIALPLFVNPKAQLNLTYFLQRDIYGDNPMTPYTVEPSVPAELSLLIANVGSGGASKVTTTTRKPKVVENMTGRYIDFSFVKGQLNGSDVPVDTYGDITTKFGHINPGATSYAEWWFKCNVLGHFTSFDINTSFADDEAESIVGEASVHELIHGIVADASGEVPLKGFLTNDIEDEEDAPDHIYLTDGTVQELHMAKAEFVKTTSTEYILKVTPGAEGWNYGKVADPTGGKRNILSVTRLSDNKTIDASNFWTTNVTLLDGHDPLEEYLIHFADLLGTQEQSYRLTYAPLSVLDVKSFTGVPKNDTEALVEPLKEIGIEFTKTIDEKTFTVDDLALTCQGKCIDPSGIIITRNGDKDYSLNLQDLTGANGYYVLSVNTKGITDNEGYNGESTSLVGWLQFLGGEVCIKTTVEPANAGTATPDSCMVNYYAETLLKADAAEGYQFSYWKREGQDEIIARTSQMTITPADDESYIAVFEPKKCKLELVNPDDCLLEGAGTGYYDYGSNLSFKVPPTQGYHFDGWIQDGHYIGSAKSFELLIYDDMVLEACFSPYALSVNYDLEKGWSWVSFSLNDACLNDAAKMMNPVADSMECIKSNIEELVNDDALGLVGPLKSLDATKAYKVSMYNSAVLHIQAQAQMPEDIQLQVEPGWNWIGYIPSVSMDIDSALDNLRPSADDIIKGESSFSTYTGEKWVGTLTTLDPGKGYMLKTAKNRKFKYPTNAMVKRVDDYVKASSMTVAPWEYDIRKYPDNMAMIAQLYCGESQAVDGRYILGAFCGDECRGVGRYIDGLIFITIHGGMGDDVINFRVYDTLTGEQRAVTESISLGEEQVGTFSNPMALHMAGVSGISGADYSLGFDIYPNPVVSTLFISGSTHSITSLKVYSISGALMLVKDSYHGEGVDVSMLSPGTYLLEIDTPAEPIYKRFIKLN